MAFEPIQPAVFVKILLEHSKLICCFVYGCFLATMAVMKAVVTETVWAFTEELADPWSKEQVVFRAHLQSLILMETSEDNSALMMD